MNGHSNKMMLSSINSNKNGPFKNSHTLKNKSLSHGLVKCPQYSRKLNHNSFSNSLIGILIPSRKTMRMILKVSKRIHLEPIIKHRNPQQMIISNNLTELVNLHSEELHKNRHSDSHHLSSHLESSLKPH
jgi:hypothetical protein